MSALSELPPPKELSECGALIIGGTAGIGFATAKAWPGPGSRGSSSSAAPLNAARLPRQSCGNWEPKRTS